MTKIEWTEKTWNPIVGCSVVSPGCTNCYAMKMAARLERIDAEERASGRKGMAHYAGTTKASKAGPVWTGKLALAPEHILTEPLRRRKATMYFVNSMSDLFHEDVPDEWIDRVFAVMALCPQHTFQVLTKRAHRMRYYLSRGDDEHGDFFERLSDAAVELTNSPCAAHVDGVDWPLPNVWLGVSAERQQEADARIPDLLATPAAVHFVSAEPLLGPIDFARIAPDATMHINALTGAAEHTLGMRDMCRHLDWIIVGGESGPSARPMHPDWVRDIRDDCIAAGVAFFFKQWGEWAPGECCDGPVTRTERTAHWWADRWSFESITAAASREQHVDDEPDLYRIGKGRAGRLLDGRTWDEMPTVAATQMEAAQ